MLLPTLVLAFSPSCVFPPPPPDEEGTVTTLEVDRQEITPPTTSIVQLQRVPGAKQEFNVESAIIRPADGTTLYTYWYVDLDPKAPRTEARQTDVLELEGCDPRFGGTEPTTVRVEALITPAKRVALEDGLADPRFTENGEPFLILQWTVLLTGDGAGCTAALP